MNLKDFVCRDDLCPKGATKLFLAKGYGVILKVKKGWFASKDPRWNLIGVEPNNNLSLTVGPFSSAKEALSKYSKILVPK